MDQASDGPEWNSFPSLSSVAELLLGELSPKIWLSETCFDRRVRGVDDFSVDELAGGVGKWLWEDRGDAEKDDGWEANETDRLGNGKEAGFWEIYIKARKKRG